MEVLIFILILLLGASLFANWNLLNKIEKYEDEIETYEEFISVKTESYKHLLNKMRAIDSRQMFEKDDDVGSVFEKLKELIEDHENF
jgi:hypothetical protein